MIENTTTINLPPRLAEQIQSYVQAGWFPDLNSLVVEALRRYLEAHQTELTERYVWQDVEWGLRGNE
ncbi:MAG: CopG family transcriptional regulator [Chloroflexi bacterium]|nr:CopG family transcriptional regulator [Chloroflexota bacterium]